MNPADTEQGSDQVERFVRTQTDRMMPYYAVRHLAGQFEELSCLIQLEDESAAMYFNIIHGGKLRRRFTTEKVGRPCEDYLLIARDFKAPGLMEEREVALFDLT